MLHLKNEMDTIYDKKHSTIPDHISAVTITIYVSSCTSTNRISLEFSNS
jgi:hypothetical protein